MSADMAGAGLTECIDQIEQEFDILTSDSPWATLWQRVKQAAILESVHDDIYKLINEGYELHLGSDFDGDFAIVVRHEDDNLNEQVYGVSVKYIHHASTLKELLNDARITLLELKEYQV